jgi:hypothetical protein
MHVFNIGLIVLQTGLAVYLTRSRPDPLPALAALAVSGLAILAGFPFYEDHWGSRVFAVLPLGVWLACVQHRLRWPLALLLPLAALTPLAALARAWLQGM